MKIPFRRPLPPAPPEDLPPLVTDVAAAEVAAGSLSGIAPSRIARHVLIVLDDDGHLHTAGTACEHEQQMMLFRVLNMAAVRLAEAGTCHHGRPA